MVNRGDAPLDVYSHDLKDCEAQGVLPLKNVALTTLKKKGHGIELEVVAVLGSGSTKHIATCPPGFFTTPFSIKINPEATFSPPQIKDLIACCPKRVFGPELVVVDAAACHGCRQCVRTAYDFRDDESDPWRVEVVRSTTEFRFPIESVGQLSPEVIAREALQHVGIEFVKRD